MSSLKRRCRAARLLRSMTERALYLKAENDLTGAFGMRKFYPETVIENRKGRSLSSRGFQFSLLSKRRKAMFYKALCYVSIALAAVTSFLLSGTLG